MGQRIRTLLGLWTLLEIAVFVLVAAWIGIGWTVLATVATSALGLVLLGKQLKDPTAPLRSQARGGTLQWGQALGDAGLVAVGGLLMLLPGLVGDLVGLLCLLPGTRALPRLLIVRLLYSRLPAGMRGPVRVRSRRTTVIDGEVGDVTPSRPATSPLQVESRRLE